MQEVDVRQLLADHPAEFKRQHERFMQGYDVDLDFACEGFEARLTDMGFYNIDLRYNISFSQGDGAAIQATIYGDDLLKAMGVYDDYPVLAVEWAEYGLRWHASCRHTCNYVNSFDTDYVLGNTEPTGIFEGLDPDAWAELCQSEFDRFELEQDPLTWIRNLSRELYELLRDALEATWEEEYFIDHCIANDVKFDIAKGEDDGEEN